MKQTYLDSLISVPSLEMIKAILPFLHIKNKHIILMLIKYNELMKIINLRDTLDSDLNSNDILNELKDFLDDDILENIEMYKSLFDLISNGDIPFDLKDINAFM